MSSSELSLVTDMPAVSGRDCAATAGADRQRDKISQIGQALRKAGFVKLDHQANALGLPRSTAWKLLRADHKASGLRAQVIARMMKYSKLPPSVRSVLHEYLIEKARGYYGHSSVGRRRFIAHFQEMPDLAELLTT
jgi:hypothetical protein